MQSVVDSRGKGSVRVGWSCLTGKGKTVQGWLVADHSTGVMFGRVRAGSGASVCAVWSINVTSDLTPHRPRTTYPAPLSLFIYANTVLYLLLSRVSILAGLGFSVLLKDRCIVWEVCVCVNAFRFVFLPCWYYNKTKNTCVPVKAVKGSSGLFADVRNPSPDNPPPYSPTPLQLEIINYCGRINHYVLIANNANNYLGRDQS